MTTLLFTSLAMLSTLLGGWMAVVLHKRVHLLLGFGAGVLLGAVFFDLLPEALTVAIKQSIDIHATLALVLLGFTLFYVLERSLVVHSCTEGDCVNEVHRRVGRVGSLGLIGHSTLDGAAIGAASLINWQTGLLVALAVVAHDLSDGLNTMMLVTHGEKPRRADFVFLLLDAIAPVVGGILALTLLFSPVVLSIFLGLASGFFIYTSTSDLLPEAHRRSPRMDVTIAALLGMVVLGCAVHFIG